MIGQKAYRLAVKTLLIWRELTREIEIITFIGTFSTTVLRPTWSTMLWWSTLISILRWSEKRRRRHESRRRKLIDCMMHAWMTESERCSPWYVTSVF